MKFLILFALVAGALASAEDCPANAHYEECGTACPITCGNYKNPPIACILVCVSGCFCDKGYVQTEDGKCVKPEQCAAENISESDSGRCSLPPKIGLCMGSFYRFYFDETTGQCQRFIYGGCGGNANNFKTEEECQSACGNRAAALVRPDCDKPAEPGMCRAFVPRYYYDQEAGQCLRFIYGGCGGNRNNFKNETECYNKCGALQSFSREVCNLDKDSGPCYAGFRRFYFNRKTGQCEKFIYGGCEGNENNFKTQKACEDRCLV